MGYLPEERGLYLKQSVQDVLHYLGQLKGIDSPQLDREIPRYLESMPDTLAHELNNPLNVVSSSLEILSNETPEARDSKYMVRAMKGIQRLRSILTSLTEAANLEEAMLTLKT